MNNVVELTKDDKYSVSEFKRAFSDLLARCNEEDVKILLESFTLIKTLPAGECLIKQGEYSDSLYLIVNGILSIEIESHLKSIDLGLLNSGQWVGDVSLIDPGSVSATVKVVEDVTLLHLSQSSFIRLRECYPRTVSRFLHALSIELAERLRVSSTFSLSTSTDSSREKETDALPQSLEKFVFGLGRWLAGIRNDEVDRFVRNQVALHQKELSQKYNHLFKNEREELLIHERKRILAELHDGVGGQLVAMLAMMENRAVEQSELKDVVRNALDDLRLMIDSLDDFDGDIPVVLGMFRSRLESRLASQNIEIDWKVTDLPVMSKIGPHEVLQILRVLQEAVTNIIKHSACDKITLSTSYYANSDGAEYVSISISDNGKGFQPEKKSPGHGMTTMRNRIHKIGGRLNIDSSLSGTSLTITLPVVAHEA